MPTEVWVAVLGLGAPLLVAAGYLLRPLGEYVGEVVRDRREEGKRKGRFQYETLIALSEAIQVWKAAHSATRESNDARARWESLTFRVSDDELRAALERLMVDPQGRASAEYGNVLRILGRLLRDM